MYIRSLPYFITSIHAFCKVFHVFPAWVFYGNREKDTAVLCRDEHVWKRRICERSRAEALHTASRDIRQPHPILHDEKDNMRTKTPPSPKARGCFYMNPSR